ncbi:MAG TPA: hypothetical protein VGC05_01710 [Mycobacterium sp.]
MNISLRSIRGAAAGTVGAAAVAGAMLFGGMATAQAAPAPTIGSSFAEVGPHGPGIAPTWGGHGFGGHGFGGHGFGRGGFGHGGFGRGGFGHGFGGWGHGGWGRGGFGHGFGGWGHRGFFPWF